jgi:hypothetical protein
MPPSSPHPRGFDFSLHMRRLCEDVVARTPELAYVGLARVAVGFSQARVRSNHGMYASLTPMRFAGGQICTVRRGRRYGIQRVHDSAGREMLYILRFYLPRFLDRPFEEKLTTVFHELWHVGPAFDGDLRRHEGRCYAHGSSQKDYDAHARALADRWLASGPPPELYDFLRYSFGELVERHGRVFGLKVANPRLIPMDSQPTLTDR